jgi:hypothetical protein
VPFADKDRAVSILSTVEITSRNRGDSSSCIQHSSARCAIFLKKLGILMERHHLDCFSRVEWCPLVLSLHVPV